MLCALEFCSSESDWTVIVDSTHNPFLLAKSINENANNRNKIKLRQYEASVWFSCLPSVNVEKTHSLLDILEVFS